MHYYLLEQFIQLFVETLVLFFVFAKYPFKYYNQITYYAILSIAFNTVNIIDTKMDKNIKMLTIILMFSFIGYIYADGEYLYIFFLTLHDSSQINIYGESQKKHTS